MCAASVIAYVVYIVERKYSMLNSFVSENPINYSFLLFHIALALSLLLP